MENQQIIVSKKDGTQTNHRRFLVRRNARKQNSYQQVIHIKLWITFFKFFQKITCILPFYVLQYNHSKENNILKEDTYYDKHSYYIKLYAVK